jgi:hypothetical protein
MRRLRDAHGSRCFAAEMERGLMLEVPMAWIYYASIEAG